MNNEKMLDHKNNVTTSRLDNKYHFESPIPGVHIYSNVWPDHHTFFSKLETDEYWDDPHNVSGIPWIREDYLDEETGKKSETCWVDHDPEMEAAIGDVLDSYLAHWNIETRSRESFRITKFSGNGDFFGMHSDDGFATPRTVSMVYYATEDYEGGELEFIHFGVTIKPKAHQLFLFPSGYSYEHRVAPVTGGNEPRVTIVSFFNQMTFEERTARRAYMPEDGGHYTQQVHRPIGQFFNNTDWSAK